MNIIIKPKITQMCYYNSNETVTWKQTLKEKRGVGRAEEDNSVGV